MVWNNKYRIKFYKYKKTTLLTIVISLVLTIYAGIGSISAYLNNYSKSYPYDIMIKSLNGNRNYCNYLYDLDCVNKIECEYWKNNTVSMNNTITKVSLVSNNGVTNGIYTEKVELNELHNNEVIVEKVGISDKLKSYPHELSGGEQQRVAIARALIINPKIIFADEPTGNFDKRNSEEIMQLFKQINKDMKVTIPQVTHSQDMANYSNRIIKLLDGEIISDSKKKKHKK